MKNKPTLPDMKVPASETLLTAVHHTHCEFTSVPQKPGSNIMQSPRLGRSLSAQRSKRAIAKFSGFQIKDINDSESFRVSLPPQRRAEPY